MKNPSEEAKLICEMYRKGSPVHTISEQTGKAHSVIDIYLKRWYKQIYQEDYKNFHCKRDEKAETLYQKFKQVYKPYIYNRTDMCRMLECKPSEFEYMLTKFNTHHLRLKTYKTQRTLCNIPQENYDEYKKYAEDHNMSVRELACCAINEYILDHEN